MSDEDSADGLLSDMAPEMERLVGLYVQAVLDNDLLRKHRNAAAVTAGVATLVALYGLVKRSK